MEQVVGNDGRLSSLSQRAIPAAAWTLRKSGLGADVVPHVLRHTAVTWTMQQGHDLWEAAGFFGMSPEMLWTVYGHHHPDYQRDLAAGSDAAIGVDNGSPGFKAYVNRLRRLKDERKDVGDKHYEADEILCERELGYADVVAAHGVITAG